MTVYKLQLPDHGTRLVKSAHLPRIGEFVSYPGVLAAVIEIVHLAQEPESEPTAVPVVAIAIRRREV